MATMMRAASTIFSLYIVSKNSKRPSYVPSLADVDDVDTIWTSLPEVRLHVNLQVLGANVSLSLDHHFDVLLGWVESRGEIARRHDGQFGDKNGLKGELLKMEISRSASCVVHEIGVVLKWAAAGKMIVRQPASLGVAGLVVAAFLLQDASTFVASQVSMLS
jgi:hypothetical protein